MPITGMNHAVLYVRDARRHEQFYRDVLGFSTVIEHPEGGFVFRLPQSKTRQAGDEGADKPVLGRAAAALSAWLEAAKVTSGPLFRRLWRERVGERRLSGAAIAAMLQRRVALADRVTLGDAHCVRGPGECCLAIGTHSHNATEYSE